MVFKYVVYRGNELYPGYDPYYSYRILHVAFPVQIQKSHDENDFGPGNVSVLYGHDSRIPADDAV